MKNVVSAAILLCNLAVLPAVFTSCDRVENAVDNVSVPVPFDIPVSYETKIPFASVPTDSFLRYPEISMNLDVDSEIKKKYPALSINNLKSVKLSAMTIELTKSLLGGNFDAVRNAKIYIKAPNLPEKLAATATENTNTNKITFTPADAELIDYFRSKENSLILEIQGRKISLDEFTIKINPSFKVSVGL